MTTSPDLTSHLTFAPDLDGRRTIAALWQGPNDPQMRFEGSAVLRATRTPEGPAAIRVWLARGEAAVEAWGPGAGAALGRVPGWLGLHDEASVFVGGDPLISDLQRRLGVRMTRGGSVFEAVVPTIVGQKVSGLEASRSFRGLLRRFGDPAPGPLRLLLPPSPEVLRAQPYHAFHTLGLERRRADALRSAAAAAPLLERAVSLGPDAVRRLLLSVPGIGPWSASEILRLALGDPDAVSVGDYHLPTLVAFALAGERRGDDARMLELLEPYRGQRARVVRLLELSGLHPPRRGPRMAPRSIAAI